MIKIIEKENCCGCGVCVNVCPRQCIQMVSDEEGFSYPAIEKQACTDCRLCEKACPMLVCSPEHISKAKSAYAAIHRNGEYLLKSSSGGVFIELAKFIIDYYKGFVVGVAIDDKGFVFHTVVNSMSDCESLMGSKYVQSDSLLIYKKTKELLQEGKHVLFSGAPCHIAGLKVYLKKEYANLITIDFACHGVPSPGVWNDYKETFAISRNAGTAKVTDYRFRDKKYGWKNFCLSYAVSENSAKRTKWFSHKKDVYLQAFISNLILRPSCYICKFKHDECCCSDISLCDYWRVRRDYPLLYNRQGVSGVITSTDKGKWMWNKVRGAFEVEEICIDELFKSNASLYKSADSNVYRASFFQEYAAKNIGIIDLLGKYFEKQNTDLFKIRTFCKAKLGDCFYLLRLFYFRLSSKK